MARKKQNNLLNNKNRQNIKKNNLKFFDNKEQKSTSVTISGLETLIKLLKVMKQSTVKENHLKTLIKECPFLTIEKISSGFKINSDWKQSISIHPVHHSGSKQIDKASIRLLINMLADQKELLSDNNTNLSKNK